MPKTSADIRAALRARMLVDPDAPGGSLSDRQGLRLAVGYTRVVIGDRGAYAEVDPAMLCPEGLVDPPGASWRFSSATAFYAELRAAGSWAKVYVQRRRVEYADYVPGMAYVAAGDVLLEDGRPLIAPPR